MGIQFTTDQVLTMAPDASSATAGKKLGNAKHWKNLGQSSEVLWGECQGSTLYQVRVELPSLATLCSCPSRKIPCKHGLGLLLLAVNTPNTVPEADHPDWITAWLEKRAASSKRKEAKESQPPTGVPSAAQKKTAEKRMAQVMLGIDRLDLWLNDMIRNGLGSVEAQPAKFWESQKAQMEDAQARGLATRVARLSTIPSSSPDWPEKLLTHVGQITLLTQAFRKIDQLEPAFQEDVRQLIGWSLKEDEVAVRGEKVTDDWLTLGQIVEDEERGRSQRTWMLGTTTQRSAMVLQFAFAGAAFAEVYPIGIRQNAELIFWPSASPQRALVATRHSDVDTFDEHLPGAQTIGAFFDGVAEILARQPWRDRFLCTLQEAIPIYDSTSDQWCIRDRDGHALTLQRQVDHWRLLALSGGMPVDFAGEWNGEALLPLGILVNSKYYAL